MRAVDEGLRTNFMTARAAARQMIEQGSGVVLHLNSASGAGALAGMGSTGPADAAVESFMRYLAAEVGPSGVRVCGIWTAGVTRDPHHRKDRRSRHNGVRRRAGDRDDLADVRPRPPAGTGRGCRDCGLPRLRPGAGITGSMTNVTAGLVAPLTAPRLSPKPQLQGRIHPWTSRSNSSSIPVTDVDRAKDFYSEKLGFNVDVDHDAATTSASSS